MNASLVLCQWNERDWVKRYRTGLSIHSHTLHSKESLDFIYAAARHSGLLRYAIHQGEIRYKYHYGKSLDLKRGWWTPPLAPLDAYRLEAGALMSMDLNPIVSITDHDDIEAPMSIGAVEPGLQVPISVEWTVPFGKTFFHFGVHNLPLGQARLWMARLAAFTAEPTLLELRGIFEELDATPGVLVIFNHPLWDEKGVGQDLHRSYALEVLGQYGEHIHALELNGLRPWVENQQVIRLAKDWGKPTISGGDRHTLEPNALVNLSDAATFGEFVDEVRAGSSTVLVTSQYRQSHASRIFHNMLDVFRRYDNHGLGWRTWADRVFYRLDDGRVVSLAQSFGEKPPVSVHLFASFMQFAANPTVAVAIKTAFGRDERVVL